MLNQDTGVDENLKNVLDTKHEETKEKNVIGASFSYRILEVNQANMSVGPHNDSTYHDYGFGVVLGLSTTMVLCMILALVGNLLVILTVIRHKGMRTRTNMFIVNLAVADLLVSIFNMPFSLITVIHGRWIFGDPFCQFNGFVTPFFLITSIHTLMYISIHKYISITRPFSQTMTNRKILCMICISWIWAGICATFTVTTGNHVLYKTGASQCGPSIPDELNEYIHSITITTFNYILPLLVMTFCYICMFREIHEHMVRIRQTSNINLENTLNQQRKITCTLFSVLACFLVCWTPFIIYSCTAAFLKDKNKIPLLANPIAYWCGYMNSACNPIIYALRSPSFRQGYKEIICQYQAYNMGGSLVTRPSISPYGTMRKISTRFSPSLLNYTDKGSAKLSKKKNFESSPLGNGILEKRRKKHREMQNDLNGIRLPLVSGAKVKHSPLKPKENFCSLQNGINQFYTAEEEFSESKPRLICKHHSFPLIASPHIMKSSICLQEETNTSSISDTELVQNDPIISFGSMSTISKRTYQSSSTDDPGLTPYPLVTVDAASLKSSTATNPDDRNKKIADMHSLIMSSHGDWSRSPEICSNRDEGKWSPISTKSLEMGRCRRSSSHASQRLSANYARKAYLRKPESPLYTASKEELVKWLSEDNLDRSEETRSYFTFGARLFTSFKNMGRHHKNPTAEDIQEKSEMKVERI